MRWKKLKITFCERSYYDSFYRLTHLIGNLKIEKKNRRKRKSCIRINGKCVVVQFVAICFFFSFFFFFFFTYFLLILRRTSIQKMIIWRQIFVNHFVQLFQWFTEMWILKLFFFFSSVFFCFHFFFAGISLFWCKFFNGIYNRCWFSVSYCNSMFLFFFFYLLLLLQLIYGVGRFTTVEKELNKETLVFWFCCYLFFLCVCVCFSFNFTTIFAFVYLIWNKMHQFYNYFTGAYLFSRFLCLFFLSFLQN